MNCRKMYGTKSSRDCRKQDRDLPAEKLPEMQPAGSLGPDVCGRRNKKILRIMKTPYAARKENPFRAKVLPKRPLPQDFSCGST